MAEPFLGMITPIAFDFAPKGFAFCDGTLLNTMQNRKLFSLLSTTFGGDGANTFALPDLRGRAIMGGGTGPGLTPRSPGSRAGTEKVALRLEQIPAHTHSAYAVSSANQVFPQGNYWGGGPTSGTFPIYGNRSPIAQLAANALSPAGENTPHENMPPFIVINYVIALNGWMPERE